MTARYTTGIEYAAIPLSFIFNEFNSLAIGKKSGKKGKQKEYRVFQIQSFFEINYFIGINVV
jgi:hypothetical protein